MVLSIVTALARNLVMVSAAVLRSRVAKDAEVLGLAPARERGAAPSDRAGPLRASRSDLAGRAVAVGPSRAMA
jgi:hypothetical protein